MRDAHTPDGELAAGRRLNQYRIDGELGRGGMGAVFLAWDTTLDRRVALKILSARGDRASRQQVIREARNSAALTHPTICVVYEVAQCDEIVFIAMEYVEGRSLRAILDEGSLTWDDACRYGREVADALAHAHDHGVVHRDLKAANVIVTPARTLKIVDFGLARRTDADASAALTMETIVPAGSAVGTPYAMAPEQVRGEPADSRTDIWALGVLLYEMVTGQRPFHGATQPELMAAILKEAPAPMTAAVPGRLRTVIERCLQKQPHDRFQTASDAAAALASMPAPPAGPLPRSATARWSYAAAALALLAAVMAINWMRTRSAQTPGVNTEARPVRDVNPMAYDDYLRGVALLERVNRNDTEQAIALLERAVGVDSTFSEAQGALAAAYAQLYGSFDPGAAAALEPKVRAAIDRAITLDAGSADAYVARGNLMWNAAHGWPHEEAARALRQALQIRPTLDRAHRALAVIYNHVGLVEEVARELAQTAESPATLFQKGLAAQIQGRHEDALAVWRAIPVAVRNTNHIGHMAWAYVDLGDRAAARQLLDSLPADTEDVNGMLAAARSVLAVAEGRKSDAAQAAAAATARAEATSESHHATFLAARTYAMLGDAAESVRWLRFTVLNGFPCYPLLDRDPGLDAIRSYPPFAELLTETRVRWEGYRTRLISP